MTTSEIQPSGLDRRSFLRAGGLTAGTALFGGTALQVLTARMAEAAPAGKGRGPRGRADYGGIAPVAARNTGDRWLALPAGFSYTILTKTGSPMSDGTPTPRSHDGMGSFAQPGGRTRRRESTRSLRAPAAICPRRSRRSPARPMGWSCATSPARPCC